MLVRSAMLPNPLVVAASATLVEFIDKVLNSNQTTAAVVEDGCLVGVVSLCDIFRRILPHYVDMDAKLADVIHDGYFDEQFEKFRGTTIGEIMTTEVHTVAPDDTVMMAVAQFVRRDHKTIPVVEDGRFVGVVTRRSVMMTVRHRPA